MPDSCVVWVRTLLCGVYIVWRVYVRRACCVGVFLTVLCEEYNYVVWSKSLEVRMLCGGRCILCGCVVCGVKKLCPINF